MADRPIIFSGSMVRALLESRKTMTRRVLKPQPSCGATLEAVFSGDSGEPLFCQFRNSNGDIEKSRSLRRAPGDRLWVRENFAIVPATAYRMSDGIQQIIDPKDAEMAAIYAAGWDRSIPKWRPSIHMPRWASRLTLIVESVKVERLQNISEADGLAEGCFKGKATGRVFASEASMRLGGGEWANARDWYADLWRSLHGVDAWAANPWVAAIGFRTVHSNIDAIGGAGHPLGCGDETL